MKMIRIFSCLFLALSASAAWADDDELVEKVVVRNRLYEPGSRFEAGLSVGFSMLPRLTEHYNFTAAVAYNLAVVNLAIEARLGYAYSRHTGLANSIASDFNIKVVATARDLADLWEMTASGLLGVRWQPVYGKLNLMAELPVHFQAYIWAGGGAALLKRESVVICNHKGDLTKVATAKECDTYFTESTPGAVVSFAIGWRFFLGQQHGVKFEIRDYSYLDSYYENINRAAALVKGNETGNGVLVKNPGITNLVQFDLGYTFIF